jgi:ubiquinone/menaquinone biosynthesis C-methylase UbiE
MRQNGSGSIGVDEDRAMKSRMEQMVSSYDSYMRRITLGREHALREMTVNLARVKPGDCVLEVGCGTGTLSLSAKRQVMEASGFSEIETAQAEYRVLGLSVLSFVRAGVRKR